MNEAFELKSIQPDMSDIPSYASLDEAALYVVEASNILFDNLKREIGIDELGTFEVTGNTISYVEEAGEEGAAEEKKEENKGSVNKSGALKERVVKVLEAFAAKIKGVFELTLRKLSELTAKASQAFGRNLDVAKLKDAAEEMKIEFKSGGYDNLLVFVNRKNNEEDMKALYDEINDHLDKQGSGDSLNKEAVKSWFVGEEKTQTLDSKGVEDIVKIITDFRQNNGFVKRLYHDTDKHIKQQIKNANKVKDSESLEQSKKDAAWTALVFCTCLSCYYQLIRQDVQLLVKLNNKVVKRDVANKAKEGAEAAKNAAHAVKHEVDNAKAVAKNAKDQAADKKGKKEEEKTEALAASAIEEVDNKTMTYTEEVESLFNWSF